MRCSISKVDSTIRYDYTFEDNTKCTFLVEKGGVIFIEIKERILFEYLYKALDTVSYTILEQGLIPTINIKNSNNFLKILAKKSGFKKIKSTGISFSVWVRHC